MNKVKIILSLLLAINLIVSPVALPVSMVYAEEPRSAEQPEQAETAEQPETPETQEQSPSPSPSGSSATPTPTPTPRSAETGETAEAPRAAGESPTPRPTKTPKPTPTPTPSPSPSSDSSSSLVSEGSGNSGGVVDDGNVGETSIVTGEANGSGAITNSGNSNYSATAPSSGQSGVSIVNDSNGSGSNNGGSVSVSDDTTTNQNNSAGLDNELTVGANSGNNSASANVGSSSIDTGDANATGTIFNSVNTNVEGVMVSEFNITDDHTGDYVLDFEGNCVMGCGDGSIVIVNEENGGGSNNSGDIENYNNDSTFQSNEADIENTLTLTANSGENTTNNNTGGDNTITTGDANVSGNVLNFVNNNLAGEVLYGVVNIFGDLVGDIIIPEEYLAALGIVGVGDTSIANTQNGSGSTNSGNVTEITSEEYSQFNNADITNNIVLEANTGENETNANTGGDNKIRTGDIDLDANIINIANTNIVGGTWWLVLVNNAGEWVGKIIGAPGVQTGSNFAAGAGADVAASQDGTIQVTNSGNGTDSTNSGNVYNQSTSTTEQTNNASIVNNIDLSANTGRNSANRNTGGDNTIVTGDANVMLNLVNFVNNNFAGSRIMVTVVNVFGSWLGDLVTPGAEKPLADNGDNAENNNTGTGGTGGNSGSSSGGSSSGGSTSVTSSSPASTATSLFAGQRIRRTRTANITLADSDGEGEVSVIADGGEVAGAETAASKTRKINLAWLLPIGLGFGLIWYARRRYLA